MKRPSPASHPPKRLRADYGTTGGSATGGKSPSVHNRLLQDSRLKVEQGVPSLPTLPFITSSVTASPLKEGRDHTDSVTGPSLRTVGPSARFVVLSDSSHHSATISLLSLCNRERESEGQQLELSTDSWHNVKTDLEAYIPSAEVDFNSAVRDLRDLDFPLLQELSNKKDASTWDC
ncbi:hypothetical protein Tco_1300407 [Tanacetum coccineum]